MLKKVKVDPLDSDIVSFYCLAVRSFLEGNGRNQSAFTDVSGRSDNYSLWLSITRPGFA